MNISTRYRGYVGWRGRRAHARPYNPATLNGRRPLGRAREHSRGGPETVRLSEDSFREAHGTFSPHGRVAYHSNESGRPEVYVWPFVPPGATSPALGSQWPGVNSGRYYAGLVRRRQGALLPQPRRRDDGGAHHGERELAGCRRAGPALSDGHSRRRHGFPTGAAIRRFSCGRFLINTPLNEAAAPITLLQNWNPPSK